MRHEQAVAAIAKEIGYENVSLSSEVMPMHGQCLNKHSHTRARAHTPTQVMPMVKAVPRGFTVTADAYLTPHIKDYVSAFRSVAPRNCCFVVTHAAGTLRSPLRWRPIFHQSQRCHVFHSLDKHTS